MTARELIRHFPRLFHMTDAESWPTIERLGLLSVTALLDLFQIDEDRRFRLESEQRRESERLSHPLYGQVVVRDQGPLSVAKLAQCLTDMTVTEWLRLLNRKVFFWPTEERVDDLLGGRLYRDRPP